MGFHLVAKAQKYVDPKTQKEKRRSPVAKKAVCQELIKQAVTTLMPFRVVSSRSGLPQPQPCSSSNSNHNATFSVPSRPLARAP